MICTIGDRPRFVSSRISPAFSINRSAVFLELPHTPHFMQFWLVTFMCPDVLLWPSWSKSFFWYAILQIIIPTTPAVREIVEAFWNHFRGNGPLTYCLYCRDFNVLLSIEESKDIIDNNNIRVCVNKIWEVDDQTAHKMRCTNFSTNLMQQFHNLPPHACPTFITKTVRPLENLSISLQAEPLEN